MKKLILMIYSLMLVIVMFTGCNTDELEDDIDSLKNRLDNFEVLLTRLNENVKAIQLIVEGNKTITDYTLEDGTYTLTLSDGTIIKLTQGEIGEVAMPEISINEDGYWVINGIVQSFKAKGNDGKTPKFQISTKGYWEMSIDGAQFTKVLDENGKPVKAASDATETGDGFFKNVEIKDDMLIVTTISDKVYSLPIVADLVASIVKPESDFENGVWSIEYGTTVTTEVNITGENYFVTVPAGGWSASVNSVIDGKAILTVTAPPMQTRAIADNSTELVLQVNKGAFWAIDKINIQCTVGNTLYDKYNRGVNLTFDDIVINKNKFGDAVLLEADYTIDNNSELKNVYFLKDDVTLSINNTNELNLRNLIVIGNSEERNAHVVINGQSSIYLKGSIANENANQGYFLWNNVTYCSKKPLYPAEGVCHLLFDNCLIKSESTASVLSLYGTTPTNLQLALGIVNNVFSGVPIKEFMAGATASCSALTFKVNNNLFYASTSTLYKLLTINDNNKSFSWEEIQFMNNTFVNVEPDGGQGFIKCSSVSNKINIEKNVFYSDNNFDRVRCVVFPLNYSSLKDNKIQGSVKTNIGFKAGGEKDWVVIYNSIQPVEDYEIITMLSENPFASKDFDNGVFVLNDIYSDYGYTKK